MYLRMRKSMFLALSDVIYTFVVAGNQHKKIHYNYYYNLISKNKTHVWSSIFFNMYGE